MRKLYSCCTLLSIFSLIAITLTGGTQTMFLTPPRVSPSNAEGPVILDLAVDFGVGDAVSWGTTLTLLGGAPLQFVNFSDNGLPFRSTNSFFDTDFSDYSQAGAGRLDLLFYNFTAGATLGDNGYVTLGQVQIQRTDFIDYHTTTPNVLLSGLDIPPLGSAVMDENGNNLLALINGAIITSNPPTPEPSAVVFLAAGSLSVLSLRRRRSRVTVSSPVKERTSH